MVSNDNVAAAADDDDADDNDDRDVVYNDDDGDDHNLLSIREAQLRCQNSFRLKNSNKITRKFDVCYRAGPPPSETMNTSV